jgi:hypothetical protein
MARAGFCRVCGRNVWLTPAGDGDCGHPVQEIENVYETEGPFSAGPAIEEIATEPEVVPVAVAPVIATEIPARKTAGGFKRFVTSPKKIVPVALALIALIVLGVVFFPRPEFVATALKVPSSTVGGEDFDVLVEVANTGWVKGVYELTILVDGQAVKTASVDLAAGAEEEVRITIPGDQTPGSYEVKLADWEGLSGVIQVMVPASFEIAGVDVSPNPLDINKAKQATVAVKVANVGEAGGSHVVRLAVNGEVVEERQVYVMGESVTEEAFTIGIAEPGSCEVTVEDVRVEIAVHQVERPANGTVLVNKLDGGKNRVTVTNNNPKDVVVVFANASDDKTALLAVFVAGGSSRTIRGIKDGTYICYYVHGADWCAHCKGFTTGAVYGRFEQNSILKSSGSSYTESNVTFGITSGTGTPTENVGAGAFPTI